MNKRLSSNTFVLGNNSANVSAGAASINNSLTNSLNTGAFNQTHFPTQQSKSLSPEKPRYMNLMQQ
jgi:hypothetical protein